MSQSTGFASFAVEAQTLGCVRGGRRVFADVSFRLAGGELLAVTGPNGSGKSSLLRLLAGLLRAEEGAVLIEGYDADDPTAHYVGHADALKPALTLREDLTFWSAYYGAEGRGFAPPACADVVGLAHALDLPVGVLSAGQRRRAALARLLLVPRPLWLLDEPGAALDRDGDTLLEKLMANHLSSGGAIVAATHHDLPIPPAAVLDLTVAR